MFHVFYISRRFTIEHSPISANNPQSYVLLLKKNHLKNYFKENKILTIEEISMDRLFVSSKIHQQCTGATSLEIKVDKQTMSSWKQELNISTSVLVVLEGLH